MAKRGRSQEILNQSVQAADDRVKDLDRRIQEKKDAIASLDDIKARALAAFSEALRNSSRR